MFVPQEPILLPEKIIHLPEKVILLTEKVILLPEEAILLREEWILLAEKPSLLPEGIGSSARGIVSVRKIDCFARTIRTIDPSSNRFGSCAKQIDSVRGVDWLRGHRPNVCFDSNILSPKNFQDRPYGSCRGAHL